jgi:hypothetical protein
MRRKLFALLAVLAFTVTVFAQDTPEPTAPPVVVVDAPTTQPVTVESGGTAVVNADEPNPLAPLLAMAGSVFAIMELIKTAFLSAFTDKLDERQKAAVNWGVASGLAVLLMLGAQPGLDIFTLTGYPNPFPDLAARVITALFIGGGNAILHALYNFLKTPRTVTYLPQVDPVREGADITRRRGLYRR